VREGNRRSAPIRRHACGRRRDSESRPRRARRPPGGRGVSQYAPTTLGNRCGDPPRARRTSSFEISPGRGSLIVPGRAGACRDERGRSPATPPFGIPPAPRDSNPSRLWPTAYRRPPAHFARRRSKFPPVSRLLPPILTRFQLHFPFCSPMVLPTVTRWPPLGLGGGRPVDGDQERGPLRGPSTQVMATAGNSGPRPRATPRAAR